jgi:hypothetical protein
MLFEKRFDPVSGRKSTRPRRIEPAVDAFKFGCRGLVFTKAKLRVDFQSKLGKFDLSGLGPSLDALPDIPEFFRRHIECIA